MRRRLSLTLIGVAATVAGAGGTIRATALDGSGRDSATYLLDVVAWLVMLTAAANEAFAANPFFQIDPRAARRRAILLASVGLFASLLGCYLASWVFEDSSPAILPGVANAVLVSGMGALLAGLLSLGWSYGGNYAARRIEKLSEEDW